MDDEGVWWMWMWMVCSGGACTTRQAGKRVTMLLLVRRGSRINVSAVYVVCFWKDHTQVMMKKEEGRVCVWLRRAKMYVGEGGEEQI